MSFNKTLFAGVAALSLILPGLASAQMVIEDAYARSSGPAARAGAAFMTIANHSDMDDRVVSVASDAAVRVELHTHIADENGVMRMREVEAGFPIAAGASHMLQRGGDHIMFMGLAEAWEQGDELTVTISFEHAEPLVLTIPVDQERTLMQDQMGHGAGAGATPSN